MYKIGKIIALAILVTSAPVHAVLIDGKDWREPIETVNITYNQLATACLPAGTCTGNIGTVSLDGWTWASVAEIEAMLKSYFGLNTGVPSGASTVYTDNNNYPNPFIPTVSNNVWMVARDPLSPNTSGATIADGVNNNIVTVYDGFFQLLPGPTLLSVLHCTEMQPYRNPPHSLCWDLA